MADRDNAALFDEVAMAIGQKKGKKGKKTTKVTFRTAVTNFSSYISSTDGTFMRGVFLAVEPGALQVEDVEAYAKEQLEGLVRVGAGVDTGDKKQQAYCRAAGIAMPPHLATWAESHLGIPGKSSSSSSSTTATIASDARHARTGGGETRADRQAMHKAEDVQAEMAKSSKSLGELTSAVAGLITPTTTKNIDPVAMNNEMDAIDAMVTKDHITEEEATVLRDQVREKHGIKRKRGGKKKSDSDEDEDESEDGNESEDGDES